jgi:hypothetical protein
MGFHVVDTTTVNVITTTSGAIGSGVLCNTSGGVRLALFRRLAQPVGYRARTAKQFDVPFSLQ